MLKYGNQDQLKTYTAFETIEVESIVDRMGQILTRMLPDSSRKSISSSSEIIEIIEQRGIKV